MEFNYSQVCTTKKQSDRLLALGLKKETADCFHWNAYGKNYIGNIDDENLGPDDVPAWSLHRLIEMCNNTQGGLTIGIYRDEVTVDGELFEVYDNTYDNLISIIECLIQLGDFNKNYLDIH